MNIEGRVQALEIILATLCKHLPRTEKQNLIAAIDLVVEKSSAADGVHLLRIAALISAGTSSRKKAMAKKTRLQ